MSTEAENDAPKTFIQVDGQVYDSAMSPKSDPERRFRDAWTKTGKVIAVDMDRARDIHRDALRLQRKHLLEALDVDSIRADESGEDKASIIAKKKVLRDVTKDARIESAQTPEQLSELTLEVLTE